MIRPLAPPSASTSKPSTWLDRLHSYRGFPPAEFGDLDHFLASQSSDSAAAESRGGRNSWRLGEEMEMEKEKVKEKDQDMSDILCDLFVMGGGRGETSNCASNWRKSSRKQQNPKFWDATGVSKRSSNARKQRNPKFWDATGLSKKSSNGGSSNDLRRRNDNKINNLNCNNNGLASSGDNSLNQHLKDPGEPGIDVEEEEEPDLKGYSKSEVTVIDSSIQGWKVEMFVFRKRKSKSVWKAREKKSGCRSLVTARRKKKLAKSSSSDKEEDDDDESSDDGEERRKKKKKKMVRVSDPAPVSLFTNGDKGYALVPLFNEGQVRDDKADQTLKGVVCLHEEAPVKSFPCSSSHWKSKIGASSVILVKPISTFDKIGTKKPGKIPAYKGQQSLPSRLGF